MCTGLQVRMAQRLRLPSRKTTLSKEDPEENCLPNWVYWRVKKHPGGNQFDGIHRGGELVYNLPDHQFGLNL